MLQIALFPFAAVAAALDYAGCYSEIGSLEPTSRFVFQSVGWCRNRCSSLERPIVGLANGTDCLCGHELPSFASIVEDGYCDSPCAGYLLEMCGGDSFFSVYVDEPDTSETPSSQTLTEPLPTEPATPLGSPLNTQLSGASGELLPGD
ncbi:hypothetical protein F5Y15DRAFT_155632 [Xylariaceae sp. FL0016]|nr:hypothetical protein F5Y15DRAFT_155632 [Xylariaceae sp. FL0016]